MGRGAGAHEPLAALYPHMARTEAAFTPAVSHRECLFDVINLSDDDLFDSMIHPEIKDESIRHEMGNLPPRRIHRPEIRHKERIRRQFGARSSRLVWRRLPKPTKNSTADAVKTASYPARLATAVTRFQLGERRKLPGPDILYFLRGGFFPSRRHPLQLVQIDLDFPPLPDGKAGQTLLDFEDAHCGSEDEPRPWFVKRRVGSDHDYQLSKPSALTTAS